MGFNSGFKGLTIKDDQFVTYSLRLDSNPDHIIFSRDSINDANYADHLKLFCQIPCNRARARWWMLYQNLPIEAFAFLTYRTHSARHLSSRSVWEQTSSCWVLHFVWKVALFQVLQFWLPATKMRHTTKSWLQVLVLYASSNPSQCWPPSGRRCNPRFTRFHQFLSSIHKLSSIPTNHQA